MKCKLCHEHEAVVPDRNAATTKICVCRHCHASRLRGDLKRVLFVAERDRAILAKAGYPKGKIQGLTPPDTIDRKEWNMKRTKKKAKRRERLDPHLGCPSYPNCGENEDGFDQGCMVEMGDDVEWYGHREGLESQDEQDD